MQSHMTPCVLAAESWLVDNQRIVCQLIFLFSVRKEGEKEGQICDAEEARFPTLDQFHLESISAGETGAMDKTDCAITALSLDTICYVWLMTNYLCSNGGAVGCVAVD